MKIHPNDVTLEELLLSLESGQRRLFLHVAGCAYCRSKLHYLPRGAAVAVEDTGPDYDTVFDQVADRLHSFAASFCKERDEAPGIFVELMGLPFDERERRLREDPKAQTWAVSEILIERCREVWISDPVGADEMARLVLILADRLDANLHRPAAVEDLRARAWAYLANIRRIQGNLQGAEEAFRQAYTHVEKGSGDLMERAVLLDLRSSLLRDQRDFDGAAALLRQAVETFLEIGETHQAGRSLVKLGTVHAHAQRPEEAIQVLHQAITRIDPERDPRLLLCARHNLVTYLADAGRLVEAQRLYRETRPLYRSFIEPWIQNRRKWVRAKIARGRGQTAHAETLFLQARDGFVAEGVAYDTALVSLELATLYAEQGRTAELKRLAGEMLPFFASRRIHREALAALTFFCQAAETEKATFETIHAVTAFLKRAEHDPEVRFQAPEQ